MTQAAQTRSRQQYKGSWASGVKC